jgi:hypothetical protein
MKHKEEEEEEEKESKDGKELSGAGPFLRNRQSLSCSRVSKQFTEHEGS